MARMAARHALRREGAAFDGLLAAGRGGIADRACALVIAGYCVVTAILYKQFWTQGDFWTDPDGKGRGLFCDFLKNLSLGAGFAEPICGADAQIDILFP